jgi:beta-lactamase regulating signal transducer with metallopeptidase domain
MNWIAWTFDRMLEASSQGAAMVILVLLAEVILRHRLSARWRCGLWMLVFLRLCLPALPSSALSLQNLMRARDLTLPAARPDSQETITFGIIPDQSHSRMQWRPALAAATPSPGGFPWTFYCAFAWLVIAAALMAWILARCLVLEWRISRLDSTSNPRLIGALLRARQEARFTRAPRIIETSIVNGPALAGIVRSRLLIPPGLAERLDDQQLRFVLLHELAHHRRWDVPLGIGTALIACVHWFNPLIWLAAALFRNERELACDAFVLAQIQPNDHRAYGQTILKLLEMLGSPAGAFMTASMLSRRSTIHRRIRSVADYQPPRAQWAFISMVLMLGLGSAALMGAARPVTTSPATMPADSAPFASDSQIVTRTYDVSDLLIHIPDFTDAPDLGLVEPGGIHRTTQPASRPTPEHDQLIAKLQRTIMDKVEPRSWRDRGGLVGSMRALRDKEQLVITQTSANQDAIERLLNEMRAAHAVEITIEARFITGGAFDELAQITGNNNWKSKLDSGFPSEAQVKRLLAWHQMNHKSTMITAPRLTLLNGQRAFVLVSRESAYVKDLKKVAGRAGEVAYDPVIGLVQSGILVDAQATTSTDHKFVTLTIRPQLATLEKFEPRPTSNTGPGKNYPVIQIPHIRRVKFKATTSIPDGQTAVFRLRPQLEPPSTTRPAPEPMMLLVKPTIIHAQKSSAR